VLDAVVDTVLEAEEDTDDDALPVLLGAGLGSGRVGLDPHSYVPTGQTEVPFLTMYSVHTSLFSSGCWQGPEVK